MHLAQIVQLLGNDVILTIAQVTPKSCLLKFSLLHKGQVYTSTVGADIEVDCLEVIKERLDQLRKVRELV